MLRAVLVHAVVVAISIAAAPNAASADTRVQVRVTDSVGRPLDASVTLRREALVRSCRTTAGLCTVAVPAGTWTVTFSPVREHAPGPRSLTVDGSGTVTLALTASATPTAVHVGGTTTSASSTQARPATRVQASSGQRVQTGATAQGTVTVQSGQPATPTTRPTASGGTTVRVSPTTQGVVRQGTPVQVSGNSTAGVVSVRPSGTIQASPPSPGLRDLSSGRRLVATGTVVDDSGQPAEATLLISNRQGRVGSTRTVRGRFAIYDLPAGSYSVQIRTSTGATSRTMTIGSGGAQRLSFRVPSGSAGIRLR